jgi:hypothetical protein
MTFFSPCRGLLLAILLSLTGVSEAQYFRNMREQLTKPPRFLIGFDARRSFLDDEQVKISGFRFGLDLGNVLRTGYGFYWMSQPVYFSSYVADGAMAGDTLLTSYSLGYLSLFLEHVLWYNKRWEFAVAGNFGVGNNTVGERYLVSDSSRLTIMPVWMVEPSASIQYKIFPWLGIESGYGYRWMFNKEKLQRQRFSNHIYFVKLRVFLGPLWRAVFPKVKDQTIPEILR